MSDKNSTQGADSSPPAGESKAAPDSGQTEGTVQGDAEGTVPAALGLPDLEAHAEPPLWLSGNEDHDGRIWDGVFETEAGAAAEPTVTKAEDVTLETPSLANPDISSEAAEAASLDDATAEVKAVEAEAADAAVRTDPAANHPAATQSAATQPAGVNHTEGITAAAPMTGDVPAPAHDAAASQAGTGGDAKEPVPAEASATSAAAGPAESRRSRRNAEPQDPKNSDPDGPEGPENNGRNKRILLIIAGLAVLAALVILLVTVLGNSEKEPGVLEEDVAPIELESGACLQDFTGINEPTTVVTCETPHNAQLVATATYPDSDEFPGTDALSARAAEVCSEVRYSETLAERGDLDLQENKVIPTPESWNDGDRRVDCFVVTGGDQQLTESLLEQ